LLSKFDGSGLGVAAFCRREAISAASLYRWRTLLSDDKDGDEAEVSKRVPVFVDLGTLNSVS
jgi:transposase-like protein